MLIKRLVFITLILFFTGIGKIFPQTPSNQIGLGWYAIFPTFHSLKLSYLYDTNKRFQFEGAMSLANDFDPDHERYGIDVFPTINIYIIKRTEKSRKLFVTTTIGPYFQYYTRNYDLITTAPLETKYERYALGILSGANLNWNFSNRLSLVLNFKIGGSYYFHYGPECKGTPFEECYSEYPYTKLQGTSFMYLNLFYKFNKRK